MKYCCEPCGKCFTGEIPHNDHLNSENHKIKVSQGTKPTYSLPLFQQPALDEFISKHGIRGIWYKCSLCDIYLNGIQQADSHVRGKVHLKKRKEKQLNLSSNSFRFSADENDLETMKYCCEPCGKCFTGEIPHNDHLNSENHKIKVSQGTKPIYNQQSSTVNHSLPSFQQPAFIHDEFISEDGIWYKCSLCGKSLNSIQQVDSHVHGKEHLKKIKEKQLNLSNDVREKVQLKKIKEKPLNLSYSYRFSADENDLVSVIKFNVDEPIKF